MNKKLKRNGKLTTDSFGKTILRSRVFRSLPFLNLPKQEDVDALSRLTTKLSRQLKDQRVHLDAQVQQRTAELNQALDAAKLADRAKDEFLANISHELRTPLNAVIGLAGVALHTCSDPKQRDYLEKIASSGKHLAGIINDLLDLSKITAGHLEFETIPFSLRDLVRRSCALVSLKATQKGLRLLDQISEKVTDILLGDPLRVEQILLNLLSNAVKFTQSGHIEVRIDVQARRKNRLCLNMEVEDSGIGMRAEDLQRLFQPFSQTDATMSRKYGGTGLGLTISQRLAEMMEGDISVASTEGRGSCFRVRIWLSVAEAGTLPQTEPETTLSQDGLLGRYENTRVLVVDDNELNREIVCELLTVVQIKPQMATNGQEALEILNQNPPDTFDLVLMDIQMPVMDGLTVTRKIRTQPEFNALPILAMTAHSMEHEKQASLAAGMNGHISKPIDVKAFYSSLAKTIAKAKHVPQVDATAVSIPRPSPIPIPLPPLSPVPPLAGIDTAAGLSRFAGKHDRYRSWLEKFVVESPTLLVEIQQLLLKPQTEAAAKVIHSLKSRTGTLGMSDLHASLVILEARVRENKPHADALRKVEQGVAQVAEEIRRALNIPVLSC